MVQQHRRERHGLATLLLRVREEQGRSVPDVATELGWTDARLEAIEGACRDATYAEVLALAELYAVSPAELATLLRSGERLTRQVGG